MSLADEFRAIVREEVRAALADRPPAAGLDDFITFREAAREVKKSPKTISNWIATGKIATYGMDGGKYVKRSEIREYLERTRRQFEPATTRVQAIVGGLAPRGAKVGAR